MENALLSTLLSVFDFRIGTKPVYCLPRDIGVDKTTLIAFKGHLILSKVKESGSQSMGLFLPFNEYDLVGFVYMFQIQTDYAYTKENTFCTLSFLAPKEYMLSCFSLISEILSVATNISTTISSKIRYKGESSDFFEIEELLKNGQSNLDKIFKVRVEEIDSDVNLDPNIAQKLSDFISKSQNDFDQLLYALLIDFNKKLLVYTPNDDFGYTVIDCMQLLTPHRILDFEYAGKGDMKVDPEIIVSTDSEFFDLQAEFFDVSINYKSNKINTLNLVRNGFVKEISEFLMKNKKDPVLVNQLVKIEMKKLLDLYLDFIVAAGALTDGERETKRREIFEKNDKDLIKAAFTLATYYNPFLNEI